MATIALNLDRTDVSVEDFTEAFNVQVRLVQEVMREMGIATSHVRWVVTELRAGSAFAAARPQVLDGRVYMAEIDDATRRVGEGLSRLTSFSERPEYFSDEALRLSRKLVELASESNRGRANLRFGDINIHPSDAVSVNVNAIIKGEFTSIGSIEGQLVGVAGTDGAYRIAILDRLRGRKVPCIIRPEHLAWALDNYERRVIARGLISSRVDGTPTRIAVRSLERMPSDESLPSRDEVRGILEGFRRAESE